MKRLLYILGFMLFAGGMAAQEVIITNTGGGANLNSLPAGNSLTGNERIVTTDSTYTFDKLISQVRDSMPFLDAREFNIYPNGTDVTAKFNAMLLYAHNNGGRTIWLPQGDYIVDSLIAFPKTADSPIGKMRPIKIMGAGGYQRGSASFTIAGSGTNLVLRYSNTIDSAKIITNGAGTLIWEDIGFISTGSTANLPFFMTTHTVTMFNRCAFEGRGTGETILKFGAITTRGAAAGDSGDPYQAYGSRVEGCWFNKVGMGIQIGTFGNGVIIRGNTYWNQCNGFCAIYVNDFFPSQNDVGISITDNIIEMNNYAYGIVFISTGNCTIERNGFYDQGVSVLANIWFGADTYQCTETNSFRGNRPTTPHVRNDAPASAGNEFDDKDGWRVSARQKTYRSSYLYLNTIGRTPRTKHLINGDYYEFQDFGNSVQLNYYDSLVNVTVGLWKAEFVNATRGDFRLIGTGENRFISNGDMALQQAVGGTLWIGQQRKYYEIGGVINALGNGPGNVAYSIGASGEILWSQTIGTPGAAKDAGLRRSSANVLDVTNGGLGFGDLRVLDEAYSAGWNGLQETPTKNAIYDQFNNYDPSSSNEGSLGVGVGGANSATIVSNTSGNVPVTIEGSTNVKVTENQPAGIITLTVPDTVFITLSALSITDSLKTVSTLGRDFFNVPAELAGFTVSKVEYSAFAAGAGSGSVTTSLRLFNSARTFTGSSNAVTWAVGDAIKTSTGAFTLALGQLIVPQITADTMTQHPLGLSVVLMLTK